METSAVFRVNGIRVGVIGATVRTTPELVRADATEGLVFLDEAERIRSESAKLRRRGVKVQVVVIHEGAVLGANAVDGRPPTAWQGPIIGIVEALQDTTIDLVIAGHTHRAANTVVGHIPVVEGFNAGASYSVAQLMVKGGGRRVGRHGDAHRQEPRRRRRGPTCRRSSTRPTPRRRCCATR